jgi:hypothetical protein
MLAHTRSHTRAHTHAYTQTTHAVRDLLMGTMRECRHFRQLCVGKRIDKSNSHKPHIHTLRKYNHAKHTISPVSPTQSSGGFSECSGPGTHRSVMCSFRWRSSATRVGRNKEEAPASKSTTLQQCLSSAELFSRAGYTVSVQLLPRTVVNDVGPLGVRLHVMSRDSGHHA